MKKTKFFSNWLVITSIIIMVMGLYMALCNTTPLFAPMNAITDPVFWPNGIQDSGTISFKSMIFSLAGAMLTVWGIYLFFISHFAFRKGEQWAWVSILTATVVWFAIDETFSVYYLIYGNAIGNIPLFLMLIIPLTFTWGEFFSKEHRKKNP
ncbi:MAG: hypothetical protein JW904_07265 [Spirochaetales bacterium]|nr:hypothetical protein [Spirochaetales bacterium]